MAKFLRGLKRALLWPWRRRKSRGRGSSESAPPPKPQVCTCTCRCGTERERDMALVVSSTAIIMCNLAQLRFISHLYISHIYIYPVIIIILEYSRLDHFSPPCAARTAGRALRVFHQHAGVREERSRAPAAAREGGQTAAPIIFLACY